MNIERPSNCVYVKRFAAEPIARTRQIIDIILQLIYTCKSNKVVFNMFQTF